MPGVVKPGLLIAVLLLSAGYAGTSRSAPLKGMIAGRILDSETREPLQAVNIMLLGTVRGASSDAKGRYIIKDLPAGSYTLRASMIGYRSVTIENVNVLPNKAVRADFFLRETPIEFDPIVVLAGKSEQRLDQAPVSISVVTSREIERRQPKSIIEALETAPGINFVGNQINIRGSTGYSFGAGNKVLLLLDGVPVYASDTGEFNWDMLPPLDIEQIEVLKGAGSTLWGASALGGVVNVITKDPAPEGRLLFSYTLGRYARPRYDVWQWTDPDRLHYTREDASYSKRFDAFGLRLSAGRLFNTGHSELGDAKKYNLTGKFDLRLPNAAKWTAYAAYSSISRGFFIQWRGQNDPYEVDPSNLDNRARINQLNLYTKLNWPVSSRLAFNFRASLVRSLMGNQFGSGSEFNPAIGQGVEMSIDWIPAASHTVTLGAQYQHDTGSTEYFGDHRGYFIGPYLQDEWRISNVRLTAGFRYDRYQLIGGDKEDLFSPRIGVNWEPWAATNVRASIGSGFRAATIVERFLELSVMNFKIKANPGLKAESSWAYDIGVRHYFNPDWNIDLSLFRNDYWELIEAHLDLIRGQIQFRNIPRARIQGIEATTNLTRPVRLLGRRIEAGLQFSLTAMDHLDLKYEEPLTYRPKTLATLKATLSSGALHLSLDHRYASRIDQVKLYPINDRVPMKFWDVRLSADISFFTLQLGVVNLFNYNYAPMESNLMPMRTYTLSLKGEL